jgi:betaine-aldehyde dehydrogenase
MSKIFANQGQVCSATSRVLLQDTVADKVMKRLLEETQKIKIGNGLSEDTKLGPLVSEGQYKKVLDYIQKGEQQGAKILCGGEMNHQEIKQIEVYIVGIPKSEDLLKGYFVPPTIFTDVSEDNPIWKEEIFGPVLCVKTFRSEDEALHLANNTYNMMATINY